MLDNSFVDFGYCFEEKSLIGKSPRGCFLSLLCQNEDSDGEDTERV